MRALVAEENVVNRAALRTVLERRGFVVDELDGNCAASELRSLEVPPDLAILSAQTVLLDFASACEALREANPDVYIAALLEADRAHEADGVLHAGANDFLVSSPFIQKLDARISVICAQVYDDLVSEPSGDGISEGEPREPQGPRRAADPSVFDYAPVPSILEQVARRLGLPRPQPLPFEECGGPTAVSGWFPVIVQRGFGARWINLRFDLDRASSSGLFQGAMRRRLSGTAELISFFQQFLGLVREGLFAPSTDAAAYRLHFPVLPEVFVAGVRPNSPIGARARTEQRGYRIGDGVFVRLTASLERSRTIERPITQLRSYDVLAMPIESGGERTLLREGIMLDDVYIGKIQSFAFLTDVQPRVHVFRPPGDTALFLSRR